MNRGPLLTVDQLETLPDGSFVCATTTTSHGQHTERLCAIQRTPTGWNLLSASDYSMFVHLYRNDLHSGFAVQDVNGRCTKVYNAHTSPDQEPTNQADDAAQQAAIQKLQQLLTRMSQQPAQPRSPEEKEEEAALLPAVDRLRLRLWRTRDWRSRIPSSLLTAAELAAAAEDLLNILMADSPIRIHIRTAPNIHHTTLS